MEERLRVFCALVESCGGEAPSEEVALQYLTNPDLHGEEAAAQRFVEDHRHHDGHDGGGEYDLDRAIQESLQPLEPEYEMQHQLELMEEAEVKRALQGSVESAHRENVVRARVHLSELEHAPPTELASAATTHTIDNGVRYFKVVFLDVPQGDQVRVTVVVGGGGSRAVTVQPRHCTLRVLEPSPFFAFVLNVRAGDGVGSAERGEAEVEVLVAHGDGDGDGDELGCVCARFSLRHGPSQQRALLEQQQQGGHAPLFGGGDAGFERILRVPQPLVKWDSNGQPLLHEPTLEMLAGLPVGKIHVIVVVGAYRRGKSCLMNALAGQVGWGFDVGHETRGKTQGLDCLLMKHWTKPDEFVLLLDTEGTGDLDGDTGRTTNIMMLSWLFASTFVYNTVGVVDTNSRDMLQGASFLANRLVQRTGGAEPLDPACHPCLVWVARDWGLALPPGTTLEQYLERDVLGIGLHGSSSLARERARNGDVIAELFPRRQMVTIVRPVANDDDLKRFESAEVQQRLKPQFREQLARAIETIALLSEPKRSSRTNLLSGAQLVEFFRVGVDAVRSNSNNISLGNAWQSVQQAIDNKAASAGAESFRSEYRAISLRERQAGYQAQERRGGCAVRAEQMPLEEDVLDRIQTQAEEKAKEVLRASGATHSHDLLFARLREDAGEFVASEVQRNRALSTAYCEGVAQEACRPVEQAVQEQISQRNEDCSHLDRLLQHAAAQYEERAAGPSKGTVGAAELRSIEMRVRQVAGAQQSINALNTDARRKEAQYRQDLEERQRRMVDYQQQLRNTKARFERLQLDYEENEAQRERQAQQMAHVMQARDHDMQQQVRRMQQASADRQAELQQQMEAQRQRCQQVERDLQSASTQVRELANRPPEVRVVRRGICALM